MGYGVYIYGIFPLPGPQDLSLEGLDRQPVHPQVIDEFVFLYSAAQQERYLASRRNLLGHEKVLEEAMKAGYRTLLPLQFGLTVDDWQTLIDQLITPYRESLKQLFLKLAGRREVSIKLFWESNNELQSLIAENQTLRERRDRMIGQPLSMDGAIEIGQAIEQAMQTRQAGIIQAFRDALDPLALEVVENELLTDAMIYNAAYLIEWESEKIFSDRVETLDHQFESRLRIRYNNFTAPYNFAQIQQLSRAKPT